jgi:3-isopropylmalate/(R)-2-methylmalate dehydratase small subunit
MQKFTKLIATSAPLEIVNIDTDMIIPKQFLKTIKRSGLGEFLFYEMRYDKNGNLISDFILNQKNYNNSKILIAGDNFGCGSSREHAPWALSDFGIKCVISTSFADIFYNNSFKNGILPIQVSENIQNELFAFSKDPENKIIIDLENQKIIADKKEYNFTIDSFKKKCLLEGLDDINLTLQKENKIKYFEENKINNY